MSTEQKEQPKPATIEDAEPLLKRVMSVMEDVMTRKLAEMDKKMDEKIDTLLKAKEVEMEKALRKGFGLESDPVVHQSDMIAFMRKTALEKAETDKRTSASEKTTPEGTIQKEADPIDALLKANNQPLPTGASA